MRKSISLVLLLTACDNGPSENNIDKCLSCALDSSRKNSSADSSAPNATFETLPYRGTLFATVSTESNLDELITVRFNFDREIITELIDDKGGIFSDSKALSGYTRPSFSPSGEKLAYNKSEGDTNVIKVYDLRSGELSTITNAYSNSQMIWKDEDIIFLTRGGRTPQGMQTLGVYEVNVNSGEAQEVIALPLQRLWTQGLGIAYDPLINLLYFSCLPKDVLPTTEAEQDEPEDEVYHTPWEICSIYGSQRDGVYGQETNFQADNIKLHSPFLSLKKGSPLSFIYAACKSSDKVGYCSGNIDQGFSFEMLQDRPTYFITFNPTSQFAMIFDGQVYDFQTQQWTSFDVNRWNVNGNRLAKVTPFDWRE